MFFNVNDDEKVAMGDALKNIRSADDISLNKKEGDSQ